MYSINNGGNFCDKRNYGLDLLKILSMILITAIHFCGYSHLTENIYDNNFNLVITIFMLSISTVSVNTFVLISGYFFSAQKFRINKIIKLYCNVLFFSVALLATIIIYKPNSAILAVIKSFFPILGGHYWFPISYIILCLYSPFLNVFINNISRVEYKYMLLMGIAVFTIYGIMNPFSNSSIPLAGESKGLLWFSFLYLTAGYIRKYNYKFTKKFWILGICILLMYMIINFWEIYIPECKIIFDKTKFMSTMSFFSYMLTLSIFGLFYSIRISNKFVQSIIKKLVFCSFGVYLIQEHIVVRTFLWDRILDVEKYSNSYLLWVYFIVLVCVLFTISYVMNIIFEKLYAIIYKHILEKYICKFEKICNRIKN